MLADHLCSVWRTGKFHKLAPAILSRAPSFASPFYHPLLVNCLLGTHAGRVCRIVDEPDEDDDGDPVTTFRLGPGLALLDQAIDLDLRSGSLPDVDIEDECVLTPSMGFTACDAIVTSEYMTWATTL